MSLVHAANHLAAQGRGEDTHLVHMTSKELAAMQHLAQSHGGSLTINPKTGLPEAGFLSSILPMAAGALAVATGQVELLPYIAAGVGAADYAMTGSLTQGLMAGIGTWSGGTLAGGLMGAGATGIAQAGGDVAAEEFAKSQTQALTGQAMDASRGMVEPQLQELAKSQIGNMSNLTADQVANMTGQGLTEANAADVVRGAGAANADLGASAGSKLASGATSLSGLGSAISNNPLAAAGVALPLLMGGDLFGNKKSNVPTNTAQKNPFGMKEIPRDENGKPIFHATLPTPVSPPYRPVYPDYVKNPYVAGAADGGHVTRYDIGGAVSGIQATLNPGLTATYLPPPNDKNTASLTNLSANAGVAYEGPNGEFKNRANYLNQFSDTDMFGPRPDQNVLSYLDQNPNNTAASYNSSANISGSNNNPQPIGAGPNSSPLTNNASTAGSPQWGQSAQGYSGFGTSSGGFGGNSNGALPLEGQYGIIKMSTGGIPHYKGSPDYGSMVGSMEEVERGLEMATRRKQEELRHQSGEIEPDEPELRRLDPASRARKMLEMLSSSSRVKLAKGLPQASVLGNINVDPAQMIAEQQAKQSIASEQATQAKEGGLMAAGGSTHLGDYSDGGHLLRGPGDGVSDSIPATIGGKQPARLATGEFVIPARIVSELGNGSTDAGAKRLYAMMDRIKAKRSKTKNIAADTKAYKYLPA